MLRSITQIFESYNNSVPPPFPIYGQWSSRMTSYVAMATKKLKNIFLTKSPTHSMKGLAIKIQLKCFIKIKIYVCLKLTMSSPNHSIFVANGNWV